MLTEDEAQMFLTRLSGCITRAQFGDDPEGPRTAEQLLAGFREFESLRRDSRHWEAKWLQEKMEHKKTTDQVTYWKERADIEAGENTALSKRVEELERALWTHAEGVAIAMGCSGE